MLKSFDIAGSGLTAQRLRMDVLSNNIANAETTRTPQGGPYRRQEPVFAARATEGLPFASFLHATRDTAGASGSGVRVVGVRESQKPLREVYRPHHPDADQEGYVTKPNVDLVSEMVDLVSASRAYESNVTVISTGKHMARQALNIGR